MANTILGYNSMSLHAEGYPMSQTLLWNPTPLLAVSTYKNQICFSGHNMQVQFNMKNKRNFSVYANTGPVPQVPPPSGQPPDSSKNWIVGVVFPFILPLITNNLGSMGVIKNRIDTTVQRVEDVAETVEIVAGAIEKAAEDILDDLPEGKLKNLVDLVERVAERTAKHADTIDDLIDKVQGDQAEDIADGEKKSPEGEKSSRK